jgi:hypothetical protein
MRNRKSVAINDVIRTETGGSGWALLLLEELGHAQAPPGVQGSVTKAHTV